MDSGSIIIESETAVVCTKAAGASANEFIVFRAENNYEKAVEFRVDSPAGKELLCEELRDEFERRITRIATDQASDNSALNVKVDNYLRAELECKDAVAYSGFHENHPIQVESVSVSDADLAAGWRLVGGGCFFQKPVNAQIYMGDAYIKDDGRSFHCNSTHTPNHGHNRQLVVKTRLCRAKIASAAK